LSAAQNGHTEIAALLLQKGATVDLATANGVTPLHFAAQEGHTALAALLLQKGASVDLAKADGATPLFMAAQEGHTLLAALLLQNGASINQARIDGATPLLLAAKQGHADIVSALILQNKSDLAAQGFFTRSRKYFFATPYVDKTHLKGNAPLIVAIQKGHLAVVSVVVAAGASIDLPDEQNNTPLLQAVRKKNPQIAALLLQAGANSSIKNKAGQSALDLALASSKPNSLLIDLVLEDASTRKQRSFFASADAQLAPQLDTAQLAEQACALLMKLQRADATVQATGWRTFVNVLCTMLGIRHIVAEGLVAMLRQMPADWPSVGGGTSKPTAAQVRQFYLHMLGSAQRLHALNNQDDPHRTAYYQAQQDMPAVAKLIGLAASQSGQLIGAGQTTLGDWAGTLQRFFSGLSAANSAADIETQLQNEMGLHPLLTTTIAPLWASLKTKSVAGLILAMRKKFNAPEFASTVLEAGDSDVLHFMLIEQLQVLNNLKAPRRNKE
jgi:ankyrin repeat protein